MHAHSTEDGVGHVAHAALHGEKLLWQAAGAVLGSEKLGDIHTDAPRDIADLGKRRDLVIELRLDHAGDFLRIDAQHRLADTIGSQ